ncbi:MAG: hemolysin family protein [Actinomycetes bacterium]
MTVDAWSLLAVALLLALTAALSAAETVLLRLSLVRALRLDEDGVDGGDALLWLLEHRTRSLNVVLFATVTARTVAVGVATAMALRRADGAAAVAGAIVLLVVLWMVVSEVAPRTLALRSLEATGLRLAPAMRALVRILDPLTRVLIDVGRLLVGTRKDVSGPFPSEDELASLLSEAEEDDQLEEGERAMIHSIFELGDTLVREIMVPRPDMVTVPRDADLRDLVDTALEHGRSRVPVTGETREEIVGVVYAKDLLRRMAMQPGRTSWHDLVREATFIPETKRIDDLLRDLQEAAVHMAIVVDEYGAVVGLVTIEDILEEIVGEIVDEHDAEEPLVEVLDDGRMRVDARLAVDDLNELVTTELPDEDWDTVGGLVFGVLGRVPEEGEVVDIAGLRLTAERVQGRRVTKVVVARRPSEDEDAAGAPDEHDDVEVRG